MIKERRRSTRAEAEIIPGEFFCIKVNKVLKSKSDIKNISAGGIAIMTENKLKKADEVFVSFQVPGDFEFVDGIGKVVRTDNNISGVKFVKVSYGAKSVLKKLVEKLSAHSGIGRA